MAIQMRRGLRADFDPSQLLAGEWAVSVDASTNNQIVWMCFGAGVVKRMGTYEDFEAMIDAITDDIRDEMLEIKAEVEEMADAVSDDAEAVAIAKTAIEETYLPNIQAYVTQAQTSATSASTSASTATSKATEAQSWAIGGTGTRSGEDTNNAKYWSERAQSASFAQSDWTENDTQSSSYIGHKPFKTVGSGLSVDANGALNNDTPSWAMQSQKPTYTAQEVGALPANTPIDIPVATASTTGKVKPDGTTTEVDANGVISVIGGAGGGVPWNVLDKSVKKNLFDFNKYTNNGTFSGVTITYNTDGTITFDGTATGDLWRQLTSSASDPNNLRKNGHYILSANFTAEDTRWTIRAYGYHIEHAETELLATYPTSPEVEIEDITAYSWIAYRIYINEGATFDNFVLKPMLRCIEIEDDTFESYVPDNTELALKSEITAINGKNLLRNDAVSETINGITYTVNGDGTILANGTATADSNCVISRLPDLPADTDMIMTICPAGGSFSTYFAWYTTGTSAMFTDVGNGANNVRKFDYTQYPNSIVQISIKSGYTADNLLFKPMIRLATERNATYVPYNMNFGTVASIATDALSEAEKARNDLTSISATGTTNDTGATITSGLYFYLNGDLCKAKTDIANGATFTLNTNYEEVTAGGLNALNTSLTALTDADYSTEHKIGKLGNKDLYERTYYSSGSGAHTATFTIDSALKNITPVMTSGIYSSSNTWYYCFNSGSGAAIMPVWDNSSGLRFYIAGASATCNDYSVTIRYTKN